jgi:hypothetical protein
MDYVLAVTYLRIRGAEDRKIGEALEKFGATSIAFSPATLIGTSYRTVFLLEERTSTESDALCACIDECLSDHGEFRSESLALPVVSAKELLYTGTEVKVTMLETQLKLCEENCRNAAILQKKEVKWGLPEKIIIPEPQWEAVVILPLAELEWCMNAMGSGILPNQEHDPIQWFRVESAPS